MDVSVVWVVQQFSSNKVEGQDDQRISGKYVKECCVVQMGAMSRQLS